MPSRPVNLSLPLVVFAAAKRHRARLPTLSAILLRGVLAAMREAGIEPPAVPPPDPQTAAATVARSEGRKKRSRRP